MIAIALVWIVGAFLTTLLGGFFVGVYIRPYTEKLPTSTTGGRGFATAGQLIGRLERFLIYLFVTAGHLEGVGFLVAAKSIFRFGELKDHEHRAEAEYITIGTMLSFAWGLGASLLTNLIIAAMKATPAG
jgi:hypothetical protein